MFLYKYDKKLFYNIIIDKQNTKMKVVKRCLLIGINYIGTESELNGCINDSINLKQFLKKNKYFPGRSIIMMNDKSKRRRKPTKLNIIRQLKLMIRFAKLNRGKKVMLFISYSGHGTFRTDHSGDEQDGRDEMLCPLDYKTAGFISDDYLKNNFINKLPENVQLVLLIDACHSGTSMDLKYQYLVNNLNTCVVHEKLSESKCQVVMVSGSKDSQTSSDAYLLDQQGGGTNQQNPYEYQGAMTAAFMANYIEGITYKDLVEKMRAWLHKQEFTQVPQLTSGQQIDTNTKFLLADY